MTARTWIVHCLDAPDSAERRPGVRPAHSLRLREPGPVVLLVYGALVGDDGVTPVGSAFLVEAPSRAVVTAWIDADPFRTAGVWDVVQVHELVVSANAPVQLTARLERSES